MDRALPRSPGRGGAGGSGALPTIVPQPTPRSRPHSPRPAASRVGAQPPPLSLPPGSAGAGGLSTILSSASLAAMGMASVGGVPGHQRSRIASSTGVMMPKLDLPPEDTEGAGRNMSMDRCGGLMAD